MSVKERSTTLGIPGSVEDATHVSGASGWPTSEAKRASSAPTTSGSASVSPDLVREVDRRIRTAHGVSRLGNKEEPLDELIFIILANKSREDAYFATFDALKARFQTWDDAVGVPAGAIAEVIKSGGLADKKARSIEQLLNAIVAEVGRADLSFLEDLDDAAAEKWLRKLPGVGPKTARCVLSYSLGRPAFAVDSNVVRLMRRLGWGQHTGVTLRVQDELQEMIPPEIRLSLHVNFVLHGRTICTQLRPECESCVLTDLCPSAFSVRDTRLRKTV